MVYQVNADAILGNRKEVEGNRDGSRQRVSGTIPFSKKLFDKCVAGVLLVFFAPALLLLAAVPEFVGFVGLSGVFLFNFRPWLPGGQSSAPNGN